MEGTGPSDEDRRTIVDWAIECAERVLPLFETIRPDDGRPRTALEYARAWTVDRARVVEVRDAALAAHAAAHRRRTRRPPPPPARAVTPLPPSMWWNTPATPPDTPSGPRPRRRTPRTQERQATRNATGSGVDCPRG